MRLSLTGGAIAVILLLAVIVGYSTFFTVDQTSQALVVRLGQPVRVITEPGLNVKMPFIDSVIYIDKRILAIESPAQEVIVQSQDNSNPGAGQAGERLVVDAFARYRITDPLKFYQTVGPAGASSQLAILLNSALRRVLGEATLADVVRNKREELMAQMRDQLDHDAQPFGIQVVDVRIRRADLPEQNSQAVYQRMQTERQREAAEFRAEGSQKSQEIRAKADRDVTVHRGGRQPAVRADPRRRATASATASSPTPTARIRISSPSIAPCRLTSGACRTAIRTWCCGPNSDFFRYFGDPTGKCRCRRARAGVAAIRTRTRPLQPLPTDARAAATATAR